MKSFLDRFILGFPVLFLKQYPYAWIAVVALWPQAPSLAAVFLAVIVIGLLSLRWQAAAWKSELRRMHAGTDGKFYVDEPPIPWQRAARNIAFLIAAAAVLEVMAVPCSRIDKMFCAHVASGIATPTTTPRPSGRARSHDRPRASKSREKRVMAHLPWKLSCPTKP